MAQNCNLIFPLRAFGVEVRRASPADASSLARLGAGLNAHQGDPTNHLTTERVAEDLCPADTEFITLLARLRQADVGYAMYHTSYETAFAVPGFYVSDLYVDEHYRGRHVGRAMLAAIVRHAKAEGRSYLWWASKIWNKEAQRVYRAWGATQETIMAHSLYGEAFDRFDAAVEAIDN